MSALNQNSYDVVPYRGFAFPEAHPDRLATIARLFGMNPAPVERCRVLEVACGEAMHLIPMAFALPESKFVGFDLSATSIARGHGAADALGLRNIELHHLDLNDIPAQWGAFDYIVAHGLYSWIAAPVRDRLMRLLAEHLAPQGVAYVSYNCHPGGHVRRMVREMLQYHVSGQTDPETIAQNVREFATFLKAARRYADPGSPSYAAEIEHLLKSRDSTIFHDPLAEVNDPVYFHQFAAQSAAHGLQYLGDAIFSDMQPGSIGPEAAAMLSSIPEEQILHREQYLDFAKCRAFRRTLLCRQEVELDRENLAGRAGEFLYSGQISSTSASPRMEPDIIEEFCGPRFSRATTSLPLAKAALLVLGASWPRRLTFHELLEQSRHNLLEAAGVPAVRGAQNEAAALRQLLLQFYAAGLIEFHSHSPRFVCTVSAWPEASALARWQTLSGNLVTNLLHDSIRLEDVLARHLVRLCDGTRDHEQIFAALQTEAGAEAQSGNGPGTEISRENLEANLKRLARLAIFTA